MSKKSFYSVSYRTLAETWKHSRFFETIRAAQAWAKWLGARPHVLDVKIDRAAPGGDPAKNAASQK